MPGLFEMGQCDFTWNTEKTPEGSLVLKIRIPFLVSDDGFDASKAGVRSSFFDGGLLRLLFSQEHDDFYPFLLGKIPEKFETLKMILGSSYNCLFEEINRSLFEREIDSKMLE